MKTSVRDSFCVCEYCLKMTLSSLMSRCEICGKYTCANCLMDSLLDRPVFLCPDCLEEDPSEVKYEKL